MEMALWVARYALSRHVLSPLTSELRSDHRGMALTFVRSYHQRLTKELYRYPILPLHRSCILGTNLRLCCRQSKISDEHDPCTLQEILKSADLNRINRYVTFYCDFCYRMSQERAPLGIGSDYQVWRPAVASGSPVQILIKQVTTLIGTKRVLPLCDQLSSRVA